MHFPSLTPIACISMLALTAGATSFLGASATQSAPKGIIKGGSASTPGNSTPGKFGPTTVGQTTYYITYFGILSIYTSTTAKNLNDRGQVVGVASGNGSTRAFFTTPGGILTLIPPLEGDNYNEAHAINASGRVVGLSRRLAYSGQGFITDTNGANSIALGMPSGATSTSASDINARGQVVGNVNYPDSGAPASGSHVFLTGANGSELRVIGQLPGDMNASATAINDAGQVAGTSSRRPTYYDINTAFLSDGDGANITGVGTLPDDSFSRAYDVNTRGQVVGTSQGFDRSVHGFVTQAGGANVSPLGALPGETDSAAYGINDAGLVVGISRASPFSNISRAIISDGTTMVDLNTVLVNGAGWTLTEAVAINNRGQIAGTGSYYGYTSAFLLTPQAQDVSSQVQIKRGGFRYNRGDDTFVQLVTLTNRSANAIPGPVSLVLDGLVGTLVNPSATTQYTSPAGRPAVTVSTGTMAPGASLTLTLQFRPSGEAVIAYTTRVLDGQGFL